MRSSVRTVGIHFSLRRKTLQDMVAYTCRLPSETPKVREHLRGRCRNPGGPDVNNRTVELHVETKTELTLGTFLVQWLEATAYSVRPRTLRRYSEYVHLHIVPTFGERTLESIGPREVQALYATKLREGMSPTSALHLHSVLHRAFGQAERWGILDVNPVDAVEAPRAPRPEMNALSPEETRCLLNAVAGDRLEALYTLALTTGMRQGELLGLRWREVDLEQRSVRVTGSLQYVPGRGLEVAPPKTPRSRRRILLGEVAVEALHRHKAAQATERAHATAWDERDLVFPNGCGRPMYATNLLARSFGALLEKAGLRHIRFHDLRHTAATLLLGEGVHPKVVSEMLGHSKTGITLDTYSHATPTMQRQAATAFDRLLQRADNRSPGDGL
jgi:integrase